MRSHGFGWLDGTGLAEIGTALVTYRLSADQLLLRMRVVFRALRTGTNKLPNLPVIPFPRGIRRNRQKTPNDRALHYSTNVMLCIPAGSSLRSVSEISKTESRLVSLNTWRTAGEGPTSLR
jgi:hypothetical protein